MPPHPLREALAPIVSPPSHHIAHTTAHFLARAVPWTLRIDRSDDTYPGSARIRTKVGTRFNWVAVTQAGLETNHGDVSRQLGMDGLDELLSPLWLEQGFVIRSESDIELGGRAAWKLSATVTPVLAFQAPELVVPGAESYDIYVDVQLGIVLRWQASIAGKLARGGQLSGLVINEPVSDTDFIP